MGWKCSANVLTESTGGSECECQLGFEYTFEFPIAKHIALRTAVRYSYENVELLGLKPFDLFWTYGFTISNF